jgi:hypothetical protein
LKHGPVQQIRFGRGHDTDLSAIPYQSRTGYTDGGLEAVMRQRTSLGRCFRLALVALAVQAAPVGSRQAEVSDTLAREGDRPLLALVVLDSQPNPQEIIQRSVEANQASGRKRKSIPLPSVTSKAKMIQSRR